MSTELTLLARVAWHGQEITAPRLRGLLALLAGDVRTGCGTERLVQGLWPDALPQHPDKALQVLVSRARAALGADVLVSTPVGYRLALADEQVDSAALPLHAATSEERARAGDPTGSLAAAEAGLALWEGGGTGAAFEGEGGGRIGGPVEELRAARAPVRDRLVRARALALARLGRHAEAAGPLAMISEEQPRDEEVLAELLRGLAATAGPAAALTRYEDYRRDLREQLGTDPGAGLKAVQRELLDDAPRTVRIGVPHEPNPLLGREDDITAVTGLLRGSRAVTVVGPGGLGKTRLAHAVGRTAEQRLVYCVPLAGVREDQDVAREVAFALGAGQGPHKPVGRHAPASPAPPADPVPAILGVLGSGPALLILDNCEQVVEGAARLVHALVSASAQLRVLATSRAPLGLTSEAVYAPDALAPDTAAELFTQRARAARPGVQVPPQAVAVLCRHLDGLPLALELAAARVRVLSVTEIARRLDDRFALLRGGARDGPERHRTLHAVVEWSWNLLTQDAQAALRTLSVFPGGFSGPAAEHVLGGDALGLLEQLAGQSLVTVAESPAGVRFGMLETVREFSAARRTEAGEDEAAEDRFLGWAREFGLAHHDVLLGAEPAVARERIRAEQDNLVGALRLALAREEGSTTAAVTAVLAALWFTGSYYPRLAALAADTGPALSHHRLDSGQPAGAAHVEVARTAAVLCAAGLFLSFGPRADAARQLLALRRLPPAPPDTLPRATATVLAAIPAMRPPAYDALDRLCDSGQPLVAGIAEFVATYVWESEHDTDRQLAAAQRMITALAPADIPSLRVISHGRLSDLCLRAGQGEAAHQHLTVVLEAMGRLGAEHDVLGVLGVRQALALACLQRGRTDEAERWLRRAEGESGPPDDASRSPHQDAFYSPLPGLRAEIALARGLTPTGLGLWRTAVRQMPATGSQHPGDPWLDPWALQIQAAAVTAHATAGDLEPVAELTEQLGRRLRTLLVDAEAGPVDLRVLGTVLHALGTAGLASGTARCASGDDARADAVRMIALAERLRALREFQPTMSADRARRAALDADAAVYAEAVSAYTALRPGELCQAARALTSGRG
ncbi:AfsR/SARP family transcriptional regulator [Streptomyces kanamyceticus]|uniref:AfsR/SARP family transcriptional regulator n=2 Tax=Streptomyces kanamyceticus TaxID=1967 RepID=A0A5J6GUF8_STRKN|nr:BTAD domain-containing putative transcriptional regulator [Streptomyces kanamyceticus]QEU96696.1 AfsR/SARP family transcriptional regulator [Streptomyces kanamyceticus]